MLEKIFAIVAALIVMYIAKLLIKKQSKCHSIAEELSKEVENRTEDAFCEYQALSGKEPDEYTLIHLECAMENLHKQLDKIETQTDSRLERREKKCKTSKKHWR